MLLAVRIRDLTQIAAALLFAASLASCKDNNNLTGKDMPVPTKAPPAGFDVDTGKRPLVADDKDPKAPKTDTKKPAPKNERPALTGAEVEALRTSLPTLDNSLVLKALSVVPHSRVATMTVCIKKPLTKATSQIIRAYRETKWQDLKVETPTHDKKMRRISANSQRYRMTGSIEGGSTIGCPNSDKHSKVALRFQERAPAVPKAYNMDQILPAGKVPARKRPGGKLPNTGELRPKSRASARPAPDSESPRPAPLD